MDGRIEYWVKLPGGGRWSPERRKENPAAWQAALAATKGLREPAQCECLSQGERPLYVTTRANGMLLARHPGTGALHRTNCIYFTSAAKQSGLGAYGSADVKETADGTKQVRLSVALSRDTAPRAPQTDAPPAREGEPDERGRVTPLGLLNLLWEESDLHRWHPRMAGKRSWAAVRNALQRGATSIEAAKTDVADRLVVLPAQRGQGLRADVEADLRNKVAWSRDRAGQVKFLLLVAELHEIRKGPKSCGLLLTDPGAFRRAEGTSDQTNPKKPVADYLIRLYCSHELADKWATSFPDAQRAITSGEEGDRVIGLFVVECRDKDGQITGDVLAGGLMVTTAEFIPFASSYERTVTAKLIKEERWFEKPLRYDSSADWCMPDFVLLDTDWPQLPMEVYGRNSDPNYARRREEKRALYQSLFGSDRHWEWIVDPAYPYAVPGFPPKRFRAAG